MSGAIRRAIGPPRDRVFKILADLTQKDINPKIDPGKDRLENIDELEAILSDIEYESTRLESSVTSLNALQDKWLNYMLTLSIAAERKEEERIYDETSSKKDNFVTAIAQGTEALDVLRAKKREAEKLKQTLSHREPPLAEHTSAQAPPAPAAQAPPAPAAQLPKISLKEFNGDLQNWSQFWQSFTATIDKTSMDPVLKLTYLVNLLTGKAADEIRGYQLTAENYSIVVDQLKKRYGDDRSLINSLYAELRNLPVSGNKTAELRNTLQSIERICRQLEAKGEQLTHSQTAMLIQSKFTYTVLAEINRGRDPLEVWDVVELRKRLDTFVSSRETLSEICEKNSPTSKHEQQSSGQSEKIKNLQTKARNRKSRATARSPRVRRVRRSQPTLKTAARSKNARSAARITGRRGARNTPHKRNVMTASSRENCATNV
jgi:hypothetical protein